MQNILKHYREILKSIDFSAQKSIIEEPENGRLLIQGTYKAAPALIKIYNQNVEREKRLKKEKIADEVIDCYNQKNPKEKIIKVDVLDLDSNGDFIWLVRRFHPGVSLANPQGKLSELNVLFNHDLISNKFIGDYNKIIGQIANNLKFFRHINDKRLKNQDLFEPRFLKKIDFAAVERIYQKLNINFNKIETIYNQLAPQYFDSKWFGANINDLMPSNVLIEGNKTVRLLDFELFSLDNYTIDICYLWLFLWRYPEWQKCLINDLIKCETDKEFFRISLIRIVTSNLGWFLRLPGEENREGHIWIKYLQAAGESFEIIMKVK